MHGKTSLLATFMIVTMLASCRSFDTQAWGECADADGYGLDSGATALFDGSAWPDMIASVDNHHCLMSGTTGYKWARLKPGRHVVEYHGHIHDFGLVAGRIDLVVEPGHRYVYGFDTCYWCMPRRYAVWVADATSGQVAWGRRPDWPSWFL